MLAALVLAMSGFGSGHQPVARMFMTSILWSVRYVYIVRPRVSTGGVWSGRRMSVFMCLLCASLPLVSVANTHEWPGVPYGM